MDALTRFGLARSRFTVTVMLVLLAMGIALYPNFIWCAVRASEQGQTF